MMGIQTIGARIGRVTGKGLAANVHSPYPVPVVMGFVVLQFIANIINLSADIGAMGAALKLLIGAPAFAYAAGFAILSVVLQVFIPFANYSPLLKVLTFSLFVYVGTVLVIHVPWLAVAKEMFFPAGSGWMRNMRWQWWLCSEPRSVPTCFSGRPRRRLAK